MKKKHPPTTRIPNSTPHPARRPAMSEVTKPPPPPQPQHRRAVRDPLKNANRREKSIMKTPPKPHSG